MSLIDGLIDELNKSADEWNESNMFELARMCRNAAYTILELQNDAELLRAIWSQERTEKRCYMSENAKLRELVRGLLTGYECGRGELCDGCTWTGMEDPHEFRCPARVKARELGVEVDG